MPGREPRACAAAVAAVARKLGLGGKVTIGVVTATISSTGSTA